MRKYEKEKENFDSVAAGGFDSTGSLWGLRRTEDRRYRGTNSHTICGDSGNPDRRAVCGGGRDPDSCAVCGRITDSDPGAVCGGRRNPDRRAVRG